MAQHVISQFEDSHFKIQDPFDHTYNPAKAIKRESKTASEYRRAAKMFADYIRAGQDV